MENEIGKKEVSSEISKNKLITNVRQATFNFIFSNPLYYISLILILIIGASLYLVGLLNSNSQLMVFSPIFLLIVPFLMYTILSGKMRGYLMEQFAKSLGYTYSKDKDLSDSPGTLFSLGHDNTFTNIITGQDKDRPVKIFLYRYIVGYGKNSRTYYYTVFENTFDGEMPHMLLHKSGFFGDSIDFSNSEDIKLEGDFNKYFSFHVEKGFEMEAYQIFDPVFMAELIDTSKKMNFEFFKNKLYIYMPKYINTRAELDSMFSLSNKLCSHLEPVINKMKL